MTTISRICTMNDMTTFLKNERIHRRMFLHDLYVDIIFYTAYIYTSYISSSSDVSNLEYLFSFDYDGKGSGTDRTLSSSVEEDGTGFSFIGRLWMAIEASLTLASSWANKTSSSSSVGWLSMET